MCRVYGLGCVVWQLGARLHGAVVVFYAYARTYANRKAPISAGGRMDGRQGRTRSKATGSRRCLHVCVRACARARGVTACVRVFFFFSMLACVRACVLLSVRAVCAVVHACV